MRARNEEPRRGNANRLIVNDPVIRFSRIDRQDRSARRYLRRWVKNQVLSPLFLPSLHRACTRARRIPRGNPSIYSKQSVTDGNDISGIGNESRL